MKDYCIISTAYNEEVRIYVSTTKNLVEKAHEIHGTWPTASAALGRFLTVSAMMGLMLKGDESVTLNIKGDGPLGFMLVETNSKGEVRGDIGNPEVYLTYNEGEKEGKLAVGHAVGNGYLHVTKDIKLKNIFTSSVELQTGEIGDDFTYYFTVSEQTPSAVGLGVLVNPDQSILASGGFIIQLLPNATNETITLIEEMLSKVTNISALLEKSTPEEILHLLSNGTEVILDKKALKYHCGCSRDKFANALKKLDSKTIEEMIREDDGAEIVCHFCHKKYHFTVDELKALKNK